MNFTIKSNDTGFIGFYLCEVDQTDDIRDEFGQGDYCNKRHNAGFFSGCTYNISFPFYGPDYPEDYAFNLYLESLGVNILLLTEEEYEYYLNLFVLLKTSYQRHKNISKYISDAMVKVNNTQTYYFIITSCSNQTVRVDVDYVIMNPNGENLSVGILELKYVMNGSQMGWITLIGLWVLS